MIAASMQNKTVEQVRAMCPQSCWCDYNVWLCYITKCISVWTCGIDYYEISSKQRNMLKQLKMDGLYKGEIPELNSCKTLYI